MTYSIVARDEATGALGIAVQSCMLAVGSSVPWVRAGIGAVATQAMGEAAYGPRCLDAIADGATAGEALVTAQAADRMVALRQVGVVGADGSVAVATGEGCIAHAGDIVGDGFVVQANMMSTPDVWSAMASAFTNSSGPLAHRLLAALVAGEGAGGDARGRMSAALVIVEGGPPTAPGTGTVLDLRADRSEDPIGDLARLLTAGDAYREFHHAVDQMLAGDPNGALTTIDEALAMLPREENMRFLRARALIASGNASAGTAELDSLIAERPTWEVIVRGVAD